jgi:hypothetical protein
MTNEDEDAASSQHQGLLSALSSHFNEVLNLETEKEIHRLTSLLAIADFYKEGSKNLLYDILRGEKYSHVSMEVKAAIAKANLHYDEAIVWSYNCLEGEELRLFMKTCMLKLDLVPLVANKENVTADAVTSFLDGDTTHEAKISYLENLSLVNFTEDFMRRLWYIAPRLYDRKITSILISKFRTIWKLDEEISDSWIIHMLDQIVLKYNQERTNRLFRILNSDKELPDLY